MDSLLEVQAWLEKNYSKLSVHAGKWVAVSGSGVVEVANSMDALSGKLTERQKSSMLITRIPTKKEATGLIF
ncbi:MAG: hypothetical protein V1708_05945 [Candidatus Micrarchaeota archaeon]